MELSEIRDKIDAIDKPMLNLFLRRMELCGEVARYKKASGMPTLNRGREREILARVAAESGDMEQYAHRLFTTLFELSRAYQDSLTAGGTRVSREIEDALGTETGEFPKTGRIGCQGVEGAYAQMAADKLFPRGNLVFFKTFDAVFDAVENGLCDYGIVPIENSSNGSVRATYELLKTRNVHIVRTQRLCVSHELLAKPGTRLDDVREVRSHPQALGQCSEFIKSLGDSVGVIECPNTAMAAEYAASHDGVAAIASKYAGKLYGLESIADNIQNTGNNYTRFICISRQMLIYPGADRIYLLIGCAHRPGALYELLAKPAALGINLVKLESIPIVGHDFEFMFALEMQATVRDEKTAAMLDALERECELFKLLGCYSET